VFEFGILGPLTVTFGGAELDLGRRQTRRLLALLLLEPGKAVSVARLTELLWDESSIPVSARAAIHTYASRLRTALQRHGHSSVSVAAGGDGYTLKVDPGTVDAHRFLALLEESRHIAGAEARAHQLAKAARLWRGPALADVLTDELRHRVCAHLDQARLEALDLWFEAEFALGHHRRVLDEVMRATILFPHAERLVAHLMTALHHSGQRGEALAAFQAFRRRLRDDLGLDPGPELVTLQGRILTGSASAAAATAPPSTRTVRVPAQLPPAVPGFVGRAEQRARLDERLLSSTHERTPFMMLTTITGTAGIGKTALALTWAHCAAPAFPDGQLFVDLRGFVEGPSVRPLDALCRFLRALGVPSNQIPAEVEEAAALYRSAIAGRRMLVVLDNAESAEQIRPLLPGVAGCCVLVTSRLQLASLVVTHGAGTLHLDALSDNDGVLLLSTMIGSGRAMADPEGTAKLASLCANIPLAVRLAAAHVVMRPNEKIGDYAAHLSKVDILDSLSADDDATHTIRAALDLSYYGLVEAERSMFRVLGLTPGPDFAAGAAAALTGTAEGEAHGVLERLAGVSLVERLPNDAYRMHDLVHRYAAGLAEAADVGQCHDARARLWAWYAARAYQAAAIVAPHLTLMPVSAAYIGNGSPFGSLDEAMCWLDDQRLNLLAAIECAPRYGLEHIAWSLVDALRAYLWLRRDSTDLFAIAELTLPSAVRLADPYAEIAVRVALGNAHVGMAAYESALPEYERARDLARAVGWVRGEAATLGSTATAQFELGQLSRATDSLLAALAIDRDEGVLAGQARTLARLGLIAYCSGRLREAAVHCGQALALDERLSSTVGQAMDHNALGLALGLLGDYTAAAGHLHRALDLARHVNNPHWQAGTLECLATVCRAEGRLAEAEAYGKESVDLAERLHDERLLAEALSTYATLRAGCDAAGAERLHERALALAEAVGNAVISSRVLIDHADTMSSRDPVQALESARRALELARRCGYRLHEAQALTVQAAAYLAAGDPAEARDSACRAIALHAECGHRAGERRSRDLLNAALARIQ